MASERFICTVEIFMEEENCNTCVYSRWTHALLRRLLFVSFRMESVNEIGINLHQLICWAT